MTKRGMWPVRAMYMLVAVALAISLIITAAPAPMVVAAISSNVTAEWDQVDTPSMEDWVLAPESTIVDFATAAPGKVAYAIVNTGARPEDPAEDWDPWYLLKSDDHAATWTDITEGVNKEIDKKSLPDLDELVAVATDGVDPNYVAVALTLNISAPQLHVFISIDGGTTFKSTGTGLLALAADAVYDFAVSPAVDDVRDIAIAGAFGIWRSQATGTLATAWENATLYDGWFGSDPVVAVHFAPSWAADFTILVVTVDGASAYLQSGTWDSEGDGSWNVEANFKPAVLLEDVLRDAVPFSIPYDVLKGATASITTPTGTGFTGYAGRYANQRYVWVHLNYYKDVSSTAAGKIFRVRDGSVSAVLQQIPDSPWLTNVSYVGNIASGKAIAGLLGTGAADTEVGYPIPTAPCQGVEVYRNSDIAEMDICCLGWRESCKPPTGNMAMAAFYVTEDKAYAVALDGDGDYDEGAWSWSFDDGETWNQLSLIDTHISFLSDVAVSPDCNKTMLVSVNLGPNDVEWFKSPDAYCDSVWYKAGILAHYGFDEYNGKWLRTWCGQFAGFTLSPFYGELLDYFEDLLFEGELDQYSFKRGLLRLNPEETNGATVYLVDHGNDKIYYNGMQTLACWEPGRAKVSQIADLAVKDESTVWALGYDGKVTMSDDYGVYASWTKPVATGLKKGWSIALWGDEILVGGRHHDWDYSPDGGETWGDEVETGAAGGLMTLAFDSYYGANDTIYAALAEFPTLTGNIARWVIGESTDWYDLGAEDYAYTGLVLDRPDPGNPETSATTGGVLYASYVGYDWPCCVWVDSECLAWCPIDVTGVARLLTPALDFCCDETDWDYLVTATRRDQPIFDRAYFIMMPQALKICGCTTADSYSRLFAIGFDLDEWVYDMEEGEYGTVWTFTDCYSKSGPDLRNPDDGYIAPADLCDCVNLPFNLNWDRICDACNYQIQFALDSDFTQIYAAPADDFPDPSKSSGIEQYGTAEVRPIPAVNPSVSVPQAFLPGVTYYWRVRSVMAENGQVIRSWWSTPRSFTVAPRAGDGVYLSAPENDAKDVARTNIAFNWGSKMAADSYNWVLSRNADFSSNLTDSKTGLTTGAYEYNGSALAYDTPYYWRVTAIKDGAPISMAVGTFRTVAETPVEPDPVAPPTPFWVWVVIAIGAVLVIVVIVLIFRTRRV